MVIHCGTYRRMEDGAVLKGPLVDYDCLLDLKLEIVERKEHEHDLAEQLNEARKMLDQCQGEASV